MVGRIIAHYQIIEKLSEGGMGVVYVAEDTVLRRRVALKTLPPTRSSGDQQFRARFLREARAISKLSHPHIATIYDYGETDEGQPYIVMELIKGPTLKHLMEAGALNIPQVVKIIEQVAEALAEAHRHGIIHRDIKPSNISLNERDEVKVLDFGLAKNISLDSEDAETRRLLSTQTVDGVIVGTPMYLSPEQALGVAVDARSDLFSLGSVLYECLAGQPAFSGVSPIEICAKVIRDEPQSPSSLNSSIPAELNQIALKLLSKKPEARYQNARELLTDLKVFQTNAGAYPTHTVRTLSVTSTARNGPLATLSDIFKRPRLSIVYLLVTIALLSLAALGIWSLAKPKPYQPPVEAKRFYDDGIRALQDGTYYKASKLLEEAVKLDPNFAVARARLAEAWAELGYIEKASTEISRATLVDRSSLNAMDALYLRAINASVSRDFNGAIESYVAMTREAQEVDQAHIYIDMGKAYEKTEDLKGALNSYREAIKRNSQYAPAYLRQGIIYARQQDFQNAETAFDKAFQLYDIQTNPEGLAEVLYHRGVLFTSKGDAPRAREELERALQVVRAFSSTSQQVKTMLQLSSVYRLLGDTELAKRYTTDAINLARTSGLSDLTTQGLIELGYVFFYRSEISEAEKHFKQALDLARNDKIRVNEVRSLFALGSLYIQQDNPDEGIPYLEQALPFFQQNGYRKEEMQSETLLGQAYDLKGNYTEALKAFGEQLRIATQLNNQIQIGLSHKGLGTALAHQEKYSEALDHFQQSYSIYNTVGNKLYAGYNLISRADVLWRLGRYEDARASLSQASSLAEQPDGKFKQLWGRLYVVRAPMALSEGLYSKAIADGQQAMSRDNSTTKHPSIESQYTVGLAQSLSGLRDVGLKTCEDAAAQASRSGDPRLIAGAQLALAEAMLLSGKPEPALTVAKAAQQLFERSGQLESEWRAWLFIGTAEHQLGDNPSARASLLRADASLSSLEQRWGDEYYKAYIARPDIREYRAALAQTSALAQ